MSCTCPDCRPVPSFRATRGVVHFSNFISDGDVQVSCTGEWLLSGDQIDAEVSYNDDYRFQYTKEKSSVTCKQCLEKMKRT